MPDCWLEFCIRKVLRPATSTQVFLGFPVSISECWDGSQDSIQVATACFSCSPPDLNLLDPYFIFMYMHINHCHRVTAHLQLNILLLLLYFATEMESDYRSVRTGSLTVYAYVPYLGILFKCKVISLSLCLARYGIT